MKDQRNLIGLFTKYLSKEILKAVNMISGYADIIFNETEDETHRDYLDKIKSNSSFLNLIIYNFIYLTGVESGDINLNLKETPFSVASLFDRIIDKGRKLLSLMDKDIPIRHSLPEDLDKYITGDEKKLEHILQNLVNNAVKFTEKGFIELGAAISEEKSEIEFYVRDTGPGIKKEQHDKLFDEINLYADCRSANNGYPRIGLIVASKLIELMGGEIGLRSSTGSNHGITFYFSLPYKPSEIEKEPVKEKDEKKEKTELKRAKGSNRVLIIEDNIVNQRLLKKILEKNGYFAETANDGREGISKYKTLEAFDLILMDIHMPVLNGYDATRLIRDLEKGKNMEERIPIIALTAGSMKDDEEKCLEAGCDSLIIKPISISYLIKTIEKYLN